jgi:hypothetical protein
MKQLLKIMKRYDVGRVTKYEITPEGYLRAEATVARIGVQTYYNADGSRRKELRLPEEVSSPDSLATFGLKSLTNDHPPVWLDSTNTKLYQVGSSDSTVSYDYGFVKVNVNITEKEAIADVLNGKQQLSAGYECELDYTPGMWRGQKYDAIQRNIRANHISIVQEGRAGPKAKIHIDTAFIAPKALHAKLDKKTMTVENKPTSEDTTRSDALLRQRVSDLEARVSDRDDTITQLRAELEEIKKDAAIAKSEALVAKTDLADYKKSSTEGIVAEVNNRIDAWNKARPYLPKQLADVLDASMSADAIKIAAVENSSVGIKLDGKPSEYIDGIFEGMIAANKKTKPKGKSMTAAAIEGAYKGTTTPDTRTKAMTADDEMWKTTN